MLEAVGFILLLLLSFLLLLTLVFILSLLLLSFDGVVRPNRYANDDDRRKVEDTATAGGVAGVAPPPPPTADAAEVVPTEAEADATDECVSALLLFLLLPTVNHDL